MHISFRLLAFNTHSSLVSRLAFLTFLGGAIEVCARA